VDGWIDGEGDDEEVGDEEEGDEGGDKEGKSEVVALFIYVSEYIY
jgi:hypothetical protein